MIKVFIPENKGRIKTNVRGFWQSDSGKLFYDYLKVVNTSYVEVKQLEALKKKYNQEAIYFIDTSTNTGKVFYNRDKIEVLNKRSIIEVKRQGRNTKLLRDYIKSALKLYSGVTIYIKKHSYIIEVYHN